VDAETEGKSDALLICDKNRHGEWEGSIPLWYHAPSLQYTTDSRRIPIDFMAQQAMGLNVPQDAPALEWAA